MKFLASTAILAIAIGSTNAYAQTTSQPSTSPTASEAQAQVDRDQPDVVITARATPFANTSVNDAMINRQSALTSVNDVIKELPGVLVNEGDAFGSSDWATSITIRGFTTGNGKQQIGSTIDGLPNGGSSYSGGSRANRFIDTLNLRTVNVSQGTADISSRSNEALGGTLDYQTSNPLADTRLRFTVAAGDFGARKLYTRFDTGDIGSGTRAFLSASTSRVHDFIGGSSLTTRDHVDFKITSQLDKINLTGWVSYDDADEAEFAAISTTMFRNNPTRDALTDTLTGIPYIDQNYRSGSRALRKNLFSYVKADTKLGEVTLAVSGYYHRMRGRGDWIPPYIVDVRNDGAGQPQSEFTGTQPTVVGGGNLGQIYFVTPTGASATMIAGCTGTAGVPAAYSPACYPANSTAVQSYRHTHYRGERYGALLDGAWKHQFGDAENVLRAGFWYENSKLNQVRDWHKLTNPRLGIAFDAKPYYIQFSTDTGADEVMYYVEDALTLGPVTARFGVKQFFLNQFRQELLSVGGVRLKSHSKPLINAGLTYDTPVNGLQLFGGYSQNFAAIGSGPLGQKPEVLALIKPETANNIEIGGRYSTSRVQASLTLYDIKFNNSIVSISSNLVTGIDYLGQLDTIYLNVGGIRSRGIEAALAYRVLPGLTLAGNYTYNHAVYIGTGNAAQDANVKIQPGRQVLGSPRNMWVLSADYNRSIFKAGISAKFVGDRFVATQGTDTAQSFTLFDANVGIDLGEINSQFKGLSLNVQATNLMDKRYLSGASGGVAFLGSPRTVSASLTLDF